MVKKIWIFIYFIAILSLLSCIRKSPSKYEERVVPGKHIVLIENYSEEMLIGTNSDSLGQVMRNIVGKAKKYWIGGGVVEDSSYRHGFYFDPNTIVIAEITAEGMQTTIQQIEQNPSYYSENGFSNGYTEHAWYVLGLFKEYKSQ